MGSNYVNELGKKSKNKTGGKREIAAKKKNLFGGRRTHEVSYMEKKKHNRYTVEGKSGKKERGEVGVPGRRPSRKTDDI